MPVRSTHTLLVLLATCGTLLFSAPAFAEMGLPYDMSDMGYDGGPDWDVPPDYDGDPDWDTPPDYDSYPDWDTPPDYDSYPDWDSYPDHDSDPDWDSYPDYDLDPGCNGFYDSQDMCIVEDWDMGPDADGYDSPDMYHAPCPPEAGASCVWNEDPSGVDMDSKSDDKGWDINDDMPDVEEDADMGGCNTTAPGAPVAPMLAFVCTLGGLFWRRRQS